MRKINERSHYSTYIGNTTNIHRRCHINGIPIEFNFNKNIELFNDWLKMIQKVDIWNNNILLSCYLFLKFRRCVYSMDNKATVCDHNLVKALLLKGVMTASAIGAQMEYLNVWWTECVIPMEFLFSLISMNRCNVIYKLLKMILYADAGNGEIKMNF